MQDKPAILFVTPVLGHPPKSGPELRIENSIKALSKISRVTLYCLKSHSQVGGDTATTYLTRFVDNIYFAPYYSQNQTTTSYVTSFLNFVFMKLFGRNETSLATAGNADFQDVISTAKGLGVNVIWLGYGNISYPLLKYIKAHSNIPVVIDTDSVWSRFVLRGCPFAKNETDLKRVEREGKAKEIEEQWGTRLADVTTAVSEVDADYYRGLTEDTDKIHIFSNVIDLNSYVNAPVPDEFIKPCIFLAGTFWSGSPMEDSVRWLLELVLPLLKRSLPDLHFYIVGRGAANVLADINDSAVTIVGELLSVLPYLTNATVAVVPLRFESGTRFKILEAGVCGIPVVSTTLGAEGIPTTHGRDILIADSPEDFAQAILRVINDRLLAESLGLNLKELVINNYSIDILASEGLRILRYLLKQPFKKECNS